MGRALATELGPDSASYSRCYVSNEAQVAAVVDLAMSRYGNNAGIIRALRPRHGSQHVGCARRCQARGLCAPWCLGAGAAGAVSVQRDEHPQGRATRGAGAW
jgi:hypothetical protein